jgi:hypothetical protein
MTDKRIGKATAIGRVGDDVLGAWCPLGKKVDAAAAVAAINQVSRDNGMPGLDESARDGTVTACGFPDGTIEAFD